MSDEGNFLKPMVIDSGDCLNECPYCRGNNLHQAHVSIFNHDGYEQRWNDVLEKYETVPKTRVTHVMADNTITTAKVPPEHTNNPSPEREGLLLEFWCETCEEKPMLAIFQHKGCTYIGWNK